MRCSKPTIYCTIGCFLWLLLVGIGFTVLMMYENTAGTTRQLIPSWPGGGTIRPDWRQPTLVMFVHPQCPCSRASVSELSELMEKFSKQLKTYVLFYKPSSFPYAWAKSDLWLTLQHTPGVTLVEDRDGIEAKRFHASISGQVFFYNKKQELLFSGGLTSTRGQIGYSAGRAFIERFITNEKRGQTTSTPVFGCPIILLHKPRKT